MKLPLVEASFFSEIQDSEGKHIASVSTFPDSDLVPQRRAFIVQACNSHAALADLAKDVLDWAEYMRVSNVDITQAEERMIDMARAALKLAGVEP